MEKQWSMSLTHSMPRQNQAQFVRHYDSTVTRMATELKCMAG